MNREETNYIDVWRFLGCLAVVWYHSNYFGALGQFENLVENWKLFFLAWSMPFFYTISAFLALKYVKKYSHKEVFSKIVRLLRLILIYTLFYFLIGQIARFLYQSSNPTIIFSHTFNGLANYLRNVAYTPAYYLADLCVIYIILFTANLLLSKFNHAYQLLITASLLFLFIIMPMDSELNIYSRIFINKLAACSVLLVLFINNLLNINNFKIKIKSKFIDVLIILSPIIIFGLLNIWRLNNIYWRSNINSNVGAWVLLLAIFPIMSSIFIANPSNKLLTKISQLGRKYSLGIFLTHQGVYFLIEPALIKVWQIFGLKSPSIILYLMIGVIVTYISMATTRKLQIVVPKLISV